jgi:hypothetical protein
MKFLTLTIFLGISLLIQASETLYSIDVHHSLRIKNSFVSTAVASEGYITLIQKNRNQEQRSKNIKLNPEEFLTLKKALAAIDWKAVSKDKTSGLDGTSVKVSHNKKSYKFWTPAYNHKERGLTDIQHLILTTFTLAGLDSNGLPTSQ